MIHYLQVHRTLLQLPIVSAHFAAVFILQQLAAAVWLRVATKIFEDFGRSLIGWKPLSTVHYTRPEPVSIVHYTRPRSTGGNGQHFYQAFFSLVPFNLNTKKPLADKSKITNVNKDIVTGLYPVKWVERISVNL